MPIAIGSVGKLYRNSSATIVIIEFQASRQEIIHQRLAHQQREKFIDDNPLIMPAYQTLGLSKDLCRRHSLAPQHIHYGVVKVQKGQMQLRDDQMHIVAWIAQ